MFRVTDNPLNPIEQDVFLLFELSGGSLVFGGRVSVTAPLALRLVASSGRISFPLIECNPEHGTVFLNSAFRLSCLVLQFDRLSGKAHG